MVRTHIEYDDFGEFVESEDLEPVGIPLNSCVLISVAGVNPPLR